MPPRKRISAKLDQKIRDSAKHRCGYCLSPQRLVMGRLEIEHIVSLAAGGSDDEDNLWLSCRLCNGHKSKRISGVDPETGETVPLFNPRTQDWWEHFRWSEDGTQIIGLTPIGRATVIVLRLSDDPDALITRREWVRIGWPPSPD